MSQFGIGCFYFCAQKKDNYDMSTVSNNTKSTKSGGTKSGGPKRASKSASTSSAKKTAPTPSKKKVIKTDKDFEDFLDALAKKNYEIEQKRLRKKRGKEWDEFYDSYDISEYVGEEDEFDDPDYVPFKKQPFWDLDELSEDEYWMIGKFIIGILIVVILIVGLPQIGQKKHRREMEAQQAVERAKREAIKAKSQAEFLERERQLNAEMAAKKASGAQKKVPAYDNDDVITRLLDDVDVEDLYDYYDFEPPEGY